MENPATWGPLERAIADAQEAHGALLRDNPTLCGLSETRAIADALRAQGLVKDGV